jgi:hypothetical protein
MSMVGGPAYILHLFMSQFLPWFSFGIAEYILQTFVLLILVLILRKVKLSFFLSFGATLLYGLVLDGSMKLTALLPAYIPLQFAAYLAGAIIRCSALA